MNDKLDRAVEAILQKTQNGIIDWERIDYGYCKENPFYRQHVSERDMAVDGINSYMAEYKEGYIFFTKQADFGYSEIAIQPNPNADITVLATGSTPKLRNLEATIKEELDNPDDFIDSLLE